MLPIFTTLPLNLWACYGALFVVVLAPIAGVGSVLDAAYPVRVFTAELTGLIICIHHAICGPLDILPNVRLIADSNILVITNLMRFWPLILVRATSMLSC